MEISAITSSGTIAASGCPRAALRGQERDSSSRKTLLYVRLRQKAEEKERSPMSRHGTVENFQSFDVNVLHRMGALQEPLISYPMVSFRWPGLVRLRANRWRVDVQFRGGAVQTIPLVWSACHFGSHRPWFRCLRCGRRAGKLYNTGVSLHCRRCLDLWYASQRRGSKSRRYLRALRLRLRLNGIANLIIDLTPQAARGS